MSSFRQMDTLRVTLDKLVYTPQLETPAERPHPFAYYLTIENLSEETVTIKGRKWVVTDARGHRVVVEGDGVVGKMPRLRPGEHFSYHSYHVIATDSVAEGAFFAINETGEPVAARIPRFEMKVPK
ncbi:MAG: ApaG domain [Chthoniobacteraceae bacterium]|nr:ApaG domain [Chthoniobacteraceae bacterium]